LTHEPINDPNELEALSPEQLFERVRPLLRQGGLTNNYEQLQRIRPNIVSVCWELGQQWRRAPRLDERDVPFSEFLAAKLCFALRALDRKQNPHLYDPHGKYQAEGQTCALEDDSRTGGDSSLTMPAVTASYPVFTEVTPWPQQLKVAAEAAQIAQASVSALLQHVGDVASGISTSPYRYARALGLSTTEARCHPATGPYLATLDYIENYKPIAAASAIR